MNLSVWIWVLIAVVVVVIIVVAVVVGRRRSEVHNRERAAELRERVADDGQLLASRRERAESLEDEADAARQRAIVESEQADALRAQAGTADELAARATEKAEILDDEAAHSRESYEHAVEEHDETLREADRRDPDVATDRHGNRVDEADGEDDAEEEEADNADEDVEVLMIPEQERLDVGDDYSGDTFAEPDAEYIDPVEHDRLAHIPDEVEVYDENAPDVIVVEEPPEQIVVEEPTASAAATPEAVLPVQGRHAEYSPSEDVLRHDDNEDDSATGAPALDPYGNPVPGSATSSPSPASDPDDDVPRDEQGRRLDPYGNPLAEDRDSQ